jgi:Protein of unknown function (DUF2868)/Domain of unknown function (DUF3482)
MTEDEARQVLLLQARETGAPTPAWGADDRAWATRQAVATVGSDAMPERFVVARAVLALQRLLPRDKDAQRWLARRGWHGAWVWLAIVLGLAAGLLADQLGAPQRVNLLAPAVWAVVGWNLLVYLGLLLPLPKLGLRDALARLGLGGDEGVPALWAQHAGPLMGQRAALVLHAAAAALALGLMAGLYLRGLVLDYRAGWQSTFLNAEQVQQALSLLLAPAGLVTGIAVPDVVPLRVGPGGEATASAAPWIHLYAATLGLFVALPRALLAWRAGAAARHGARHFRLPLSAPYFEALHPLMRPGLPRALRLLWLSPLPAVTLFGHVLGALAEPLVVLRSEEGDELELHPPPPTLAGPMLPAVEAAPWWAFWRTPPPDPLAALREQVDAVLLVTAPGVARPAWLGSLGLPMVVLADGPAAPEPPQLALHALAEGWLPDGRLLRALQAALPDDPRLPRLAAAWTAQQQTRFDAVVAELADTLARLACRREPVADEGLLGPRAVAADAARRALLAGLDAEWRAHGERLAAQLGMLAPALEDGQAVPGAAAALKSRVGEGRAAVMGGMLSGALAGLKADLVTGGMTMGAGALAGGVIGALGAAGAARGINAARGTERSHVAFDDAALAAITQALLQRALVMAHGLLPDVAAQRLEPALAAQQSALATLWRTRPRRADDSADVEALARLLRRLLGEALRQALAAG